MVEEALNTHLKSGTTSVCRAWILTRKDGVILGFTDHDRDLSLNDVTLKADTGLSAGAIQQGSGLSVDNSEAVGMLSDAAITEADIQAGRYDGAEVVAYLLNWQNTDERTVLFKGSLGEIARSGGAFSAELRGLTEALNQPKGRIYQGPCSAVLGDVSCKVDLDQPGYFYEGAVQSVVDRKFFEFSGLVDFDDRWFEGGRFRVLTGVAANLIGLVKNDRLGNDARRVELWQDLAAEIAPGDLIRIEAGCDKRLDTCRFKFSNILNFQGFPHIPGEDWQMSYPTDGQPMDGGSLFR